jgi:hypothetical protein
MDISTLNFIQPSGDLYPLPLAQGRLQQPPQPHIVQTTKTRPQPFVPASTISVFTILYSSKEKVVLVYL